ncbi:type-F conjugative transfer system pilin assembly protein TrbC [Photobacterium damselae]|uniref:type-F conjugative transfer system pilin assembly protein TrbC n=1 Tax=Photobacterium damselae TaxID=38293 RepID=UPI00406883DC
MKLENLMLAVLFSLTLPVHAWTEQEAKAAQQQKEAQAASFFMPETQQSALQAHLKAKQYQSMATDLGQAANQKVIPSQNPNAAPPSVMIFASLGMPKTSLKQLLHQANDKHIPIVIRGVTSGGFTQTAQLVKALVLPKDNQKPLGGMSINPIWFKQFGINRVPAFVVMKPGACQGKPPCDPKNFDVVYGNVSLFDALNTIATHGDHAHLARKALQ